MDKIRLAAGWTKKNAYNHHYSGDIQAFAVPGVFISEVDHVDSKMAA